MSEGSTPAGRFSSWLLRARSAQVDEGPLDVPCGECNACCRSAYFIHVRPDETETLARIPRELQFPAPGLPEGHVVLGHDERGHCPMLIEDRCSIYENRPRICRGFDCRVFAATGIAAGDGEAFPMAERIRRWKFDYPDASDRSQQSALRAAVAFLRDRARDLPAGFVPRNPTQLANLAIKVHGVFLEGTASDQELVKAVVRAGEQE